ncbi:SDR family oxidoreductase [Roseiarcaceae bacterium H3SJ34-1]|uniref:SDR family NAD(P)-dependent oxidoreductase n=1 Tax=Terripilifer ovatus TaxID=3032367 RepID=UPI003AB96809|nr:SDR family oxidoreductase [Roseiarcaceae bacterium H3SJ34-1]
MRFIGKTALITGGGGVIGKATARLLHKEGANVVLVDHAPAALEPIAAELGATRMLTLVADVTKADDCRAYAGKAQGTFGPIDIFFNNAGIEGPSAPMAEFPEDEFARVMAVNVTGVFLGLKYVLPVMRHGGSVIITSSTAGLRGAANFTAYTASKHAVVGLMRTAAVENARRGIRVNTIHPAMVDSEMMRRIERTRQGNKSLDEVQQEFRNRIPLGRYLKPEEIADTVAHLASDASAMVTGTQVLVDGGSML